MAYRDSARSGLKEAEYAGSRAYDKAKDAAYGAKETASDWLSSMKDKMTGGGGYTGGGYEVTHHC